LNSSIPVSKLTVPSAGRDHIQGGGDAVITLLEYGDYECPYCGDAHPVVRAIRQQSGARLCFAFRHFPLVNAHPHAEHAAEAAEAAGAQGRFWEMHDMLFENQEALEDDDLARYASALGLDAKRLTREVSSRNQLSRIREDFHAGARAGVNGTPTFFINGAAYEGEVEVEPMLAALHQS
jgi:protein-disulfide isomerase